MPRDPNTVNKHHVYLDDGAAWPNPVRAAEVNHTLRYGTPTRGDILAAAGIVSTYLHIVTHPAGTEAIVAQVRQMRRILRNLAAAGLAEETDR